MSDAALDVRERERERDGIQQITKTPSCNKTQKDFPLAQLAFSI